MKNTTNTISTNYQLPALAIHALPRSGSTWLGQIFNSHPNTIYRHQPLFSYEFKNALTANSNPEDLTKFFSDLATSKGEFLEFGLAKKDEQEVLTFDKLMPKLLVFKHVRYHHLLPMFMKNSDMRLVILQRHPCGIINSWLHAKKEFLPQWNVLDEWRFAAKKNRDREEEFNGFQRWKDAQGIFADLQREWPSRVFVVNYEDLRLQPERQSQALFTFAGLDWSEQSADFLQASQSRSGDAYSVFQVLQKDEKWKSQLLPEIRDAIMEEMEDFLLNATNRLCEL